MEPVGVDFGAATTLLAHRPGPGLGSLDLRAVSRDELAGDVDHVLLVGGLSRIPVVGRRIAALLPKAQLYAADAGGVPSQEAVVAGLAGDGHDRVSLHRPAFDLVLDWGRGRSTLYEAYTPAVRAVAGLPRLRRAVVRAAAVRARRTDPRRRAAPGGQPRRGGAGDPARRP